MNGFRTIALAIGLAVAVVSTGFAAGAIAVDDEEGVPADEVGYGFETGHATREDAGRAALNECKAQGNTHCKVVVRFDQCGAYAVSRTTYGVGWGRTERAARDMAIDACGSGCRIVVAECE